MSTLLNVEGPALGFDLAPVGGDLRGLARHLPGGVPTMIRLARLSPDERVHAVALRWLRLPRRFRRTARLESLCISAGVGDDQFFVEIVATACELGIDATGILAAHRTATIALQVLAARATGPQHGTARRKFLEACGTLPRQKRRSRAPRVPSGAANLHFTQPTGDPRCP